MTRPPGPPRATEGPQPPQGGPTTIPPQPEPVKRPSVSSVRCVDLLSVAQAADLLGVSPARIRQRIAEGSLPAQKVGAAWVLERAAIVPAAVGRPLGGLLALAVAAWWDGVGPRPASWQEDRVRAKVREIERWTDEELPRAVRRTFARRAERRLLHVRRATVGALRSDSRVLRSGVHDPRLTVACEPEELPPASTVALEAYVPWMSLAGLLADHGLPQWDDTAESASDAAPPPEDGDSTRLPVVLRVSPGWLEQVPRLFSMADLLEHDDPVCANAAVRLFRGRRRPTLPRAPSISGPSGSEDARPFRARPALPVLGRTPAP